MRRPFIICFCVSTMLLSCAKISARFKNNSQANIPKEQIIQTSHQQHFSDEIDELNNLYYIANSIDKDSPKSIEYKTEVVLKAIKKYGQFDPRTFEEFYNAYIAYCLVLAPNYSSHIDEKDTLDLTQMTYEDNISIINTWRKLEKEIEKEYGCEYVDSLYKNYLDRQLESFTDEIGLNAYVQNSFYVQSLLPTSIWTYLDEMEVDIFFDRLSEMNQCIKSMTNILFENKYQIIDDVFYELVIKTSHELEQYGYIEHAISNLIHYQMDLTEYEPADPQNIKESNKRYAKYEKVETELGYMAWRAGDFELLQTCTMQAALMSDDYMGYDHRFLFHNVNELTLQLVLVSRLYNSFHNKEKRDEYLEIAERLIKEDATWLFNDENINTITKITVYEEIAQNGKDFETTENAYAILQQLDTIWSPTRTLNHASFYVSYGEYGLAKPLLKQVMDYITVNPGLPARWKLQAFECERNIAIHDNNQEMAHNASRDVFNLTEKDFLSVASRLTSRARANYWEDNYSYTLEEANIFDLLIDKNKADISYDAAIFHKGILKRIQDIIDTNIRKSSDERLKQLYEEYKTAQKANAESTSQKEAAYMYQYSLHPEFVEIENLTTWRDVQKNLSKNEIAIEYALTCDLDVEEFILTAILLKKDYDAPKIIRLCSELKVDNLLRETQLPNGYSTAYDTFERNGNSLYKMIWEPIESELKGINTIYFAPYSVLYYINLEALRKNETSDCLFERYNMVRVSSTEEICYRRKSQISTAAVFGNLDYNNPSTITPLSSGNISLNNPTQDPNENSQLRALMREWKPLTNTKKEIESISSLLSSKKVNVKLYTEQKGTEKAFKELSSIPVSIIHLATHGFYFDNEVALNINYFGKEDANFISSGERSGIVLSGANNAWKRGEIIEDVNDGVLKADEIMGMDLSNTDLLVLSACQSALGDSERDGIYGIQRGFKIAGVNTIIMSLWEVDDEATSLMMQSFYKHLMNGKNKRDAFKMAQLDVRNTFAKRAKNQSQSIPKYKRYDSDYYWASFIMLD